jgi:predicted amidohydrolase YtcJ
MQKPDLVIHNGTIYTMDRKLPVAEAVAVCDGRIVFVGSNEAVQPMIGDTTMVLDLAGKTMTPGFIDCHVHLLNYGRTKMQLDLRDVKNYDELVDRVAQAVSKAEPGAWIIGRSWHQGKWHSQPEQRVQELPAHHAVSKVSPDNPVFLYHASCHAALANVKAMEIAGITHDTTCSDEGEIVKDEQGNPSGMFNEQAMELIKNCIPEYSHDDNKRALKLAIDDCTANGVTTVHEAGVSRETLDLFKEFLTEGRLPIRLYVMIDGTDEQLLNEWYSRGPEIGTGDNFLTVRTIKLLLDGALGARGAWLIEPYADCPGQYGLRNLPLDYVSTVSGNALKYGFQMSVHAIGDRANHEALNQFERVFKQNTDTAKDHRFRIEHAQHLNPQDIPRFGKMGVIASVQCIHMSSDRQWAIERLGEKRIKEGAYLWQKLLQSGATLINGTDIPAEPVNPIPCFYAAVTRRTLDGYPAEGFEPEQKMTREQALRSYTLDAAYGAFEEDIKGSIEVGKVADFTAFSQDIMKVEEDNLLQTNVDYTVINGNVVYKRE